MFSVHEHALPSQAHYEAAFQDRQHFLKLLLG
jgi:hypothetical protein